MMQESSGASELLRQVPGPGSEHPADTAMVVLWRPGSRVQEVRGSESQVGAYSVVKWIGGSREKSVRVKGKLRVNMFQFSQVQGGGQSKARPKCMESQC